VAPSAVLEVVLDLEGLDVFLVALHTLVALVVADQRIRRLVVIEFRSAQVGDLEAGEVVAHLTVGEGDVGEAVGVVAARSALVFAAKVASAAFAAIAQIGHVLGLRVLVVVALLALLKSMRALQRPTGEPVVEVPLTSKGSPIDDGLFAFA